MWRALSFRVPHHSFWNLCYRLRFSISLREKSISFNETLEKEERVCFRSYLTTLQM